MPQSLHRTWAALAIAALAVLVVAIFAGRDLVRDVNATCPGSLRTQEIGLSSLASAVKLEPVYIEIPSSPADKPMVDDADGPAFHLVYDQKVAKGYGYPTQYSNVRLLWRQHGVDDDRMCTCGAIPIVLSGEAPSDLHLFHEPGTSQYTMKGRTSASYSDDGSVRAIFTIDHGKAHRVQADRIFSRRHLPVLVSLFALGALVVALLRSRRAISYALTIYGWTEARLTPGGLLENEAGATLGTLEQTRIRQVPAGPVLVAPEALNTSGLYRDVPIVARRHIAEGTHTRWASGTMLRLRDARVLAIMSTASAMLALAAQLMS